MFYRIVITLLVALSAGVASAQRRTQKPESPRALTEEQVEERLDDLKSGLLLEIMPETKKRGELQKRRWLAEFHVVQTDHYLMFTNTSRTMANKFSKGVEDVYEFVQKQFPFEDIDELLTCYVFNMAEEYYNFTVEKSGWSRQRAENTGGHAARDRETRKSYYATHYLSPTAALVTHEASHQIVMDCLRVSGLGSWFSEGMATYLEKMKANDKPSATMRSDLRNGDYHSLEDFFTMASMSRTPRANATRNADPAAMVRRNYTHAGALIDFMVNTKLDPVAGRFPEFLEKARKRDYARGGNATVNLVRAVYDMSPSELEELWKRHHRVTRR